LEILKNLNKISEKLNITTIFDKNLIEEFFEILLKKNLTFYELDKSDIINKFAFYIDNNLYENIKSIKEMNNNTNNNKEIYISNRNFDENIIDKLRIIFECLCLNEHKIIKFLDILQICIKNMNCFITANSPSQDYIRFGFNPISFRIGKF
jgi:hypothetical protein